MKKEYARKYFDLANAITGFAVVQMITFLIAFGTNKEFAKNVIVSPGWDVLFAATVFATLLYVLAVLACLYVEVRLLPSEEQEVILLSRRTAIGRAFAIAAISIFGLCVLFQIRAGLQ